MTILEVQNFLDAETKKGNSLAQAYVNLLEESTPEMREYWYIFLGNLFSAMMESSKSLSEKENK